MFVEINETLVDINKISRVDKVVGEWFKFRHDGETLNWPKEYREKLVEAIKESYPQ